MSESIARGGDAGLDKLSEALVAPPPVEPNAAVRGRVLQFDGLRAVAFGLVYLNHFIRLPLLWAGVDVFFVLSGFLITGILLERKRLGGPYFSYFYRRRAFRILPSYVLAIIGYGLLFTWSQYKPLWLFLLAPNVQAFCPHPADFLPLWSLAIEEQFYLVWPLLVLFTSEKTLLRLSVAALVFTPILRVVCTPLFPNHFYIYALTPFRADLLCAGAALALLWKRRTPVVEFRITRWAGPVCLLGLLLFAGTQAFPAFRLAHNTRVANGLVYLFSLTASAGLVACTLTSKGWLRALLSTPPLRFMGEISYTMYLFHEMIGVRLERHFGFSMVVKLASFLAIVAYASVSWFLMERPLIRFAARGRAERSGDSKPSPQAAVS